MGQMFVEQVGEDDGDGDGDQDGQDEPDVFGVGEFWRSVEDVGEGEEECVGEDGIEGEYYEFFQELFYGLYVMGSCVIGVDFIL